MTQTTQKQPNTLSSLFHLFSTGTYCTLPVALLLTHTTLIQAQTGTITGSEFNPAISLILDGRYTDLDHSELELPGFQLGGEAGLPAQGFSTGHNELAISANIDDRFYGSMNTAIVYDGGETELELEEAFIETLALGSGFTIKAGRFFSGIGYLNGIHDHAHDFSDRPLVYDALFGGHLTDTGLQGRWLAPTDQYLLLGVEATTGSEYPGGENEDGNKGLAGFVKTGGDIGQQTSWQLGASYYQTEFDEREAGGHHHGHEEKEAHELENVLSDADLDVFGIDAVIKWAPNGNAKQSHFKLQGEYFVRQEQGQVTLTEDINQADAQYDGEQTGFYLQAVYQFQPAWRVGLRYDRLQADNQFSNFVDNGIDEEEFLEESGLASEDDPEKTSLMIDYSHSHFSRLRLQFSQLDNGHEKNDIITLQYTMSLGAHGTHSY